MYKKMQPIFTVITVLTFITVPFISKANDGFGALGIGGIIVGKTDDIALEKELLEISRNLITVHYDFVNESNKDITSIVTFPLPAYPADSRGSGIIAHGEPDDFKVFVNNSPVEFKTKVFATIGKIDITDELRKLGFTDKQIASFPFDSSLLKSHQLRIPPSKIKKLKKKGFLLEYEAPAWQIHVSYEWVQTFPAKSTLHISHSYRPFVAVGTASGYDKYFKDDFCINKEQKSKLDALLSDKKNLNLYYQINGAIIEYILTTANTWKDGVRNFKLRIHTATDDEIVSTCYPKIKKLSARTFGVDINNFKPQKDLQIYIGNTKIDNDGEDFFGKMPQLK
jgi:hypothetical protein